MFSLKFCYFLHFNLCFNFFFPFFFKYDTGPRRDRHAIQSNWTAMPRIVNAAGELELDGITAELDVRNVGLYFEAHSELVIEAVTSLSLPLTVSWAGRLGSGHGSAFFSRPVATDFTLNWNSYRPLRLKSTQYGGNTIELPQDKRQITFAIFDEGGAEVYYCTPDVPTQCAAHVNASLVSIAPSFSQNNIVLGGLPPDGNFRSMFFEFVVWPKALPTKVLVDEGIRNVWDKSK